MKKVLNAVLKILTFLNLIAIIFIFLNAVCGWIDLSSVKFLTNFIVQYMPLILLSCFAFGSLIGRKIKGLIISFVIICIVVIIISTWKPEVFQALFNKAQEIPPIPST